MTQSAQDRRAAAVAAASAGLNIATPFGDASAASMPLAPPRLEQIGRAHV
jgi:hypothetical protein